MKMKKFKKRRYLAMLLVFVLCMGMLDIPAFAAPSDGNIAVGADQKEESGQTFDDSQPTGDAQPSGDSQTTSDAQPSGDNQPTSDAQPSGDSQTSGDAQSSGDSQPTSDAQPSENSQPTGDVQPSDDSQTTGDVQISENIQNNGAEPEENVETKMEGDAESGEKQEENVIPGNATVEDFWAAVDEMGEAGDEDSVRKTIEKILSIYERLSEEDKADEAVQKAYKEVKAYAEKLGQDEINSSDDDDTYTVIYKDSSEYGGGEFQKTEGLKAGDPTPEFAAAWFIGKNKDFYAWTPKWENTVGGENHTITYTAVYKAEKEYSLTIYYEWAGTGGSKAAPDYTAKLYRDDSYSVDSPELTVPFEYAVNFSNISGTVGGVTHDIKYWVTYTPKVKIQHVYRVNGEVVGEVYDDTARELPFGKTLTENSYGISRKYSYGGKYYPPTEADTVTLPSDPSQLTEQPVLKLYYDRTEKKTHNVIIHYMWAGTDVKAAKDQVNSFEEGKFYLVNSLAGITTAPFANIITDNTKMTISGIMGTEDIEYTVYYSPQYQMKYVLQENGVAKYAGYYNGIWPGAFGRSYTANIKIGDSYYAGDPTWGDYYCTKIENAVFPANPADLKATPEITLYFNKTIPTTLTVTKTADREEVSPGDTVTYTITVENTGAAIAKDVKITDVLDGSLKFEESTIKGSGNVYTIGDIPAGESRTLEITAKVSDDVPDRTIISNTAKATYTNKPENTPDPSGKADITVTDTPDDEQVIITLKYVYVDENGSETVLRDDMEVLVNKGEEYDVSEQVFETIAKDGLSYRKDSVDGSLMGTAAENTTITVKYVIVEETPENPTEPEEPTPSAPPVAPPGEDGGETPDPTPEPPTPEPPAPVVPTPEEIVPNEPVPAAVTPNVISVIPTVVAAAVPEEQETVLAEIGEERVPLADGQELGTEQTVEVEEEKVPLAGSKGGSWALFNFALMNLAIFESIMLLIGYFVRTKNDEDERKLKKKGLFRIISLPVAVISLVVFVLTENIHLQTALVDKYTVVMLLIAVVQTVMVVLSKKKYEEEQEEQEVK